MEEFKTKIGIKYTAEEKAAMAEAVERLDKMGVPRAEIMREMGINLGILYKLLRMKNRPIKFKKPPYSPEMVAKLGEAYPHHSNKELAEMFGISTWTVDRLQKLYRWHKSKAHIARMQSITNENLIAGDTAESHRKAGEAFKKTWKAERRRAMGGEKQKTRLRVVRKPRRTTSIQWLLCHNYGYERDPADSYTLLWTAETRRVGFCNRDITKNEEYYTNEYFIKFRAKDEEERL